MLRQTRGPGVLFLVSAEYSALMLWTFPGTWATWPWLSVSVRFIVVLRPWSRSGVTRQSFWFLDLVVLSCCAVKGWFGPVGWLNMCEMDFVNPNLSVAVAKCWHLGFVVSDRTSIWLVCITTLTQMTGFISVYYINCCVTFMRDLNGNYLEWLGSTTMNSYAVAAHDLQLYPVVISWWLAQFLHVEELLTYWWPMFLT